jgi:hypothetical protein
MSHYSDSHQTPDAGKVPPGREWVPAGPKPEPCKPGGYLDQALNLDPTKSFTESWLERLYGKDSLARGKKGDSDLTTLGRAGYSVLASPLALEAVVVGHLLDNINYGPLELGEHHLKETNPLCGK